MKTFRLYFKAEMMQYNVDVQAMDKDHVHDIADRMSDYSKGLFKMVDVVEILSEKELTAIAESVE